MLVASRPLCMVCSFLQQVSETCWQVYDPARLRRLDVSMFERLVEGNMPVQQLLVSSPAAHQAFYCWLIVSASPLRPHDAAPRQCQLASVQECKPA